MNARILPGKTRGVVTAPPSKSMTHRAICLASLAKGASVIKYGLRADDTEATIAACRSFGVEIARDGNALKIKGAGGRLTAPVAPIDCGLSGTTLRFVLALAALAPAKTVITGEARLRARPIQPLIDALKTIGAEISLDQNAVTVQGGNVKGGSVTVPGSVSSQFISALLMIAPVTPEGLLVTVEEPFYSRPYVDLTIDLMRVFGVAVRAQGNQFSVESGQQYCARNYTVEGDYSSAQYWFAAAAITGGEVRMEGLAPDSTQGDKELLNILGRMGCEVKIENDAIIVRGRNMLKPFSVDGRDIPDFVPTLAVLAAVADGMSEITNIAHLRGKESDRLAAPVEELKKMGICAEITGDALRIQGGQLRGASINPHGDHRLAMAFAVAGLAAEEETVIQNAEVVSKSYPGFWETFGAVVYKHASATPARARAHASPARVPPRRDTMLARAADGLQPTTPRFKHFNIVLIGMRGSWKSTVGKLLAERLGNGLRETDAMVEKQIGRPIADFVREQGWDAFREREAEAVLEAAQEDRMVISTGGGVILREDNIKALKAHGYFVFLYAPVEMLIGRIKYGSDKRPLLTNAATFEEDMKRIGKEREPRYRAAADVVVNSVRESSQLVADEVMNILKDNRIV